MLGSLVSEGVNLSVWLNWNLLFYFIIVFITLMRFLGLIKQSLERYLNAIHYVKMYLFIINKEFSVF